MFLRANRTATTGIIDLADLKVYLRIDDNEFDTVLATLAMAAMRDAEAMTGRPLLQSTWELTYTQASGDEWELPIAPCSALSGVTHVEDGSLVTVDQALYLFTASPEYVPVIPAVFATSDNFPDDLVTITVTCGYATLPKEVEQWLWVRVATWFDNTSAISTGRSLGRNFVDRLLDPYREHRV